MHSITMFFTYSLSFLYKDCKSIALFKLLKNIIVALNTDTKLIQGTTP